MTEHTDTRITFKDATSANGAMKYTFEGVAALVITDTTDAKGRAADYVAIDSMTCVYLEPGQITFEAGKCWCGAVATVRNEATDATAEHLACADHVKDGYTSLEPADAPKHRVVICGPNLRDQSKGTFHVHAEGCADLKRSNEPEYRNGWTVEVGSRDDVVLDVYGPEAGDFDFDTDSADDWNLYRADFYFFPCCAAVPQS